MKLESGEEWIARNRRPGPSHTMFIRLSSTVGLHTYCTLFLLKYPFLHFFLFFFLILGSNNYQWLNYEDFQNQTE